MGECYRCLCTSRYEVNAVVYGSMMLLASIHQFFGFITPYWECDLSWKGVNSTSCLRNRGLFYYCTPDRSCEYEVADYRILTVSSISLALTVVAVVPTMILFVLQIRRSGRIKMFLPFVFRFCFSILGENFRSWKRDVFNLRTILFYAFVVGQLMAVTTASNTFKNLDVSASLFGGTETMTNEFILQRTNQEAIDKYEYGLPEDVIKRSKGTNSVTKRSKGINSVTKRRKGINIVIKRRKRINIVFFLLFRLLCDPGFC